MAQVMSTKDLVGKKVWIERPKKKDPDATKKMGKVRACVFHPEEKRCVGFIVKRPDVAWMFRRKDLFVSLTGYEVVGDNLLVLDTRDATDKGACDALGITYDDCVLWVGMPVMSIDGKNYGTVGAVTFDSKSGAIDHVEVDQGATANTLLGKRHVPADLIRGFKRGIGAELAYGDASDEREYGAILVDNAVAQLPVEGGVAEKAGVATAVAGEKIHQTVNAVKPKVSEAAAVAGEAVNKGAVATGRQLKRASGMFGDFKSEFDKASGAGDASAARAQGAQDAALEAAAVAEHDKSDKSDEAIEYVYLDEDGNEIIFVDENGDVITDPDLIDAEFEDDVVIEAGAPVAQKAPSPSRSAFTEGAATVGSHLKKAGGMFSAFKEEYDKAREK